MTQLTVARTPSSSCDIRGGIASAPHDGPDRSTAVGASLRAGVLGLADSSGNTFGRTLSRTPCKSVRVRVVGHSPRRVRAPERSEFLLHSPQSASPRVTGLPVALPAQGDRDLHTDDCGTNDLGRDPRGLARPTARRRFGARGFAAPQRIPARTRSASRIPARANTPRFAQRVAKNPPLYSSAGSCLPI
jgi:hypothetical protein